MTFDIYSILASIAAGQGLFLAVILYLKKENKLPNRLLATFLFLLAFTLFHWVLWWTESIHKIPALMGWSFCIPFLYGPLMFLFYQSTFERKKLNGQDIWHFVPAMLAVFFMLPFYLRFFENIAGAIEWIPLIGREPWFPFVLFSQMAGYGIWVAVRFRKYFLENKELRKWHRYILAAYWGIVAAYIFYSLLSVFDLSAPGWIYMIAFSLTFFIYFIAWLGYIEPRIFQGEPLRKAINLMKYKKSSLRKGQSETIFSRISELMENEKIYRRENFSLQFLSEHIAEQRHHISQCVNEHAGMSFPKYVATFRVADAQRLLSEKDKREMNVGEVAFAVGFNTKKAFNLAFKSETGMTPTEYRRRNGSDNPT